MTTYLIEFGPAWNVPPLTVDFTDRAAAIETITKHAIPYLTPALAEKGRPELADCFFHANRDLTVGAFMTVDLAGESVTRFCPARLTPDRDPDDDTCHAVNDDVTCGLVAGHDGDHCADATVSWPTASTPV
jgi:hypothetical protein